MYAIGRTEEFFDTIRNAQSPEKFSLTFLKDLGFTSSNERLFIGVLKGLGFLDDGGAPTDRYFEFLDDSKWQIILADGIREAYEDLFRLNRNAHQMERSELTGKLKSLTRGHYSEGVVQNMAKTFEALCELANFDLPNVEEIEETPQDAKDQSPPPVDEPDEKSNIPPIEFNLGGTAGETISPNMTYRIEIVLPSTRDQSIYDAIFRSLREHILSK
ncbi:MAG: DUF5343 domain-containing protein [Planctomycetota bacterium]